MQATQTSRKEKKINKKLTVGDGVPAFRKAIFTDTTSPSAFKPAFTKSNWDERNLLTLSMLLNRFSMALLSYSFDP